MAKKKQIKIAYFPSNTPKATVLSMNGKSLDKYCTKCETEEDLSSGNYILDANFLIEDNLQDLLQEEVILKVLMDYGEEIFRVSKVKVGTRYIDIVARQITIADSLTLWLEDVRPTSVSGSGACTYLVNNAQGTKEIDIISDISTVNTAYYQKMSLYKALHDCDQSFLNRWGGQVLRRGYIEYLNANVGIDRGVSIREGKNLKGFECNSNIDKLVTKAQGKGFNGIVGNYINSPLINNYHRVYTDIIEYSDVKIKDENNQDGYDTLALAQAELDRRIALEYSKNGIDKIKASYNINFVQLEKTEEYKNYLIAERVYIGDTLRVYISRLNTDIKVRTISKKYDVLSQKTKEIKLSNYVEPKALSINQIIDRLNSMDSTETVLNLAKENASALLKSGMKNSYVLVRENEILIMDTKDINTATKVWRFNNKGLGYSSTGYNGTFGLAITIDGVIVADFVKTGVLSSFNGNTTFNLQSGIIQSIQPDGSKLVISPQEGFYNMIGSTKREYHHLNYYTSVDVNTDSTGSFVATFTLPNEFKNKNWNIKPSIEKVAYGGSGSLLRGEERIWIDSYNTATGSVVIKGQCKGYICSTFTSDFYLGVTNFNPILGIKVGLSIIA